MPCFYSAWVTLYIKKIVAGFTAANFKHLKKIKILGQLYLNITY